MEGLDEVLTPPGRQYFFKIIALQDFDLILRGIQDLNLEDWRTFTKYEGYDETDIQIHWFWNWLGELSAKDQKEFLCFWTSTYCLPAGGFKDMDPLLLIRKKLLTSETDLSHFPSVQTCIHSLDIPPYNSEEMLRSRLQMAINNHILTSGSFGKL